MMEKLFLILLGLAIVLCLSYFLLIANYCYAWLITKTHSPKNNASVFVSIIIAVRNEEKNISKCLNAILEQTYSSNQFEIIVVDDASTDDTNKIVQDFSEKYSNIKLVTLSVEGKNTGKKAAVKTGIENAKGELIVTTDGDCWMEKNWLSAIASFYLETNAKMIIAPVCFQNEKNSFEKMQSLEFMALIACGGASLYYNMAIMCNGANLAYPKRVFEELNGFEGIDEKVSGDDVLLMYKIKKKYRKGLKFLKSQDAIVFTEARPDLKSFVHQRKRWASKGFKALNVETKAVALLIYCFSFLLITLPILGSICLRNTPFYPAFIEICLILLLIKCFIDFLLLFLAATFFKKKKLLIYFLPEQLIYMLYVVLIGFIGTIGKYEWKGRQIN
jgi:cellulose synthase/poly-beta-1,6-N-acetylglucosamine synthase-like glycosyltransferase